jgi:hypothetical protein
VFVRLEVCLCYSMYVCDYLCMFCDTLDMFVRL